MGANGGEAARRLLLLSAAAPELAVRETLLLALQHAMAALGGLGGLVHLHGTTPDFGLRLVASSGLPQSFTRGWDGLRGTDPAPPARAVRNDAPVWQPASMALGVPADTGMMSVPLRGSEEVLGALTVLVGNLTGGPSPRQRGELDDLAEWAAERLRRVPPATRILLLGGSDPAISDVPRALEAVRVGAWEYDVRTGEVAWNASMLEVLGLAAEDFDGRVETWQRVVHPDDLPRVMAEVARAMRERGETEFEYRVLRPDGAQGWVQARGRTLTDEAGKPVGMAGALWDTTRTRAALESVARALRQMTDGFLAVGPDWRITFVNVQAERLFGSSEDLTGRLLWEVPAAQRVAGLPVRCRRAVAEGTPTEFEARWPGEGRWYHVRLLPGPEGLTIHLTDVTERRVRKAERAAADRAAAERAARIRELTAALSEAVTARDVVTAVADRVLPPFGASALVVHLVENDRLRVLDAIGYDEGFLKFLDGIPLSRATAVNEALQSGVPTFYASPEEFLERNPGSEKLVAGSGKRAWAFVPLTASGRSLGACVIAFDHPRRVTAEERTLLIAVSGLVAQALERAQLFDTEHRRAKALQRGLLPQGLPEVTAVSAAARYLPAGRGIEVGGDWYDVLPLSADRVALVIGDVMGHGLSEAATMGRLRTAVHTLSDLELPPDEILGHLNDVVSGLGDDFYATCLYAVYDPTTRGCVFARAGHPPPAVMDPDGRVWFPDLAPNAPLGTATPPFDTDELELPDGSLLVLYTDGLVESRGRDFDEGMTRLADTLVEARRRGVARNLDALSEAVASTLVPARLRASDDAALLVVRTHGLAGENIAVWSLPEDPVAAGEARHHVREQLARWDLAELTMPTELIASELVGNVIRHARGPLRLRLLRSRTLICEVSDGSHTTPHLRRASETDEGGRGLQLVGALSQRWGTRYTQSGKTIWAEQPLPEALTP
ncbi:SpoIIE family protein phosphatase [Streptomyces sp. B6B3]|uniref:SpoIIE family protein phosphatase n=1 Tax=Streptomyces sp. B6B3 TaxID=3153570 RepID=UPI00325F72CF